MEDSDNLICIQRPGQKNLSVKTNHLCFNLNEIIPAD